MNRKLMIVILVLAGWGTVIAQKGTAPTDILVYFSPKGGCTEAIVAELGAARTEVKVLAYSFTSAPIAEALAKAHERGVKLTVVLDDSNERDQYTGATYLTNHQVPVLIDGKHALMHDKIIIIDRTTVITGSFNLTKAAEDSNAENLLVIHRADLAAKYLADFAKHEGHARAYKR